MILFPPIWSSSAVVSLRDCVISKRVISMGEPSFSLTLSLSLTISPSSRETNLKIKQAHQSTANLLSPAAISQLSGHLRSEQPNNSLYTFEATMSMSSAGMASTKDVPLGPDQILLRGAQLRNTAWLYGIVIFTGHETKLMRNAT